MAYMTQQLGLSRSTLLSLLVMVSTVAIFATGATFAISVSDSASGTVKAGAFVATLDVKGTGDLGALAFTGTDCPSALLPGTVCMSTVTVENTGNLPLILDQPVTTPPYVNTAHVVETQLPSGGCLDAHWPVSVGNLGDTTLGPGESAQFLVSVTLSLTAPMDCQNETATVSVTVNANTAS